jgi:hypothetical protein
MPFGRIAMRCAASLAAILCGALAGESAVACYDEVAGVQRRFILDGGDAHDTKTSLTWKRCSLGMTWDGNGCTGEQSFKTLAEAWPNYYTADLAQRVYRAYERDFDRFKYSRTIQAC